MKRCHIKLTLLLILMTSFFVSCGIPNYFYTTSNFYGTTRVQGYYSDYTKFRLYLNSNAGTDGDLDLIFNTNPNGPGLMLLYYISDSGDTRRTLLTSEKNLLDKSFQDKFQGPNKLGINVGRITDSETILSFNYSNSTYNFQAFCFSDGNLQVTPEFITYLSARNSNSNIDYNFQTELVNNQIQLTISPNEIFGDSDDITKTLIRFNRAPFKNSSNAISSSDTDYSNFSKTTSSYFVHIFAAITPQIGSFSNAFWTNLMEVGYVEVPLV